MHTSVRRAVRCALFLGTAAVVGGTFSQAVLAAEDSGKDKKDDITEIVVTGSRIARPEIEASTPVQIINAEAITAQGAPNIADILQKLPSVGTPGVSRTNSNFLTSSNGVSTINLRNMGDKRTLVLINGRRVVSGIGGTSTVDINNIPTDLIENVQVLTGGASAAYGSEAVAGVVNFTLKKDFEGVSLRAQTGLTGEHDRKQNLWSLTFGQNITERGNVTFNIQYDKDYGLRSRDRKISANDNPSRSSFAPQGVFDPNSLNTGPDDYTGSRWTYDANNQLKQGFSAKVDGFNRNHERYIAVPLERKLYTLLAHYDLTERTKVFFEGGYSDMDSRSSLEPLATSNADAVLPDGTVSEGLSLDNPFIPDAIRADMIAANAETLGVIKRMNGVFDRSNVNTRDFRRYVVGFEGEVFNNWKWDLFYNHSQTKEYTASQTALRDRYYYALDAITGPDGTPICRDAAARANGCAPFNPFGFNSVSPEAGAYITNNGQLDTYHARVEQKQVAANINGPVFAMPAGDLMVAAGVERRWEESAEVYSADTQAGNTMGNALSNTFGDYTVNEAYVETIVPLLKDLPAVKSLEAEGSARIGDYSTVGNVFSWKGGLNWAPIDDVRFRAVYSKATRAPNIGELFGGANQTFPTGLTDPCDGTTAASTGPVAAYCRSIPGIAQQIAQNGVFEYSQGDLQSIQGDDSGNPNVGEEEAQTWTVGLVFTPTFAPNLTASVDWFQIQIDDAITLLPRQYAIDQCANSGGTSPFCAYETRELPTTARPRTPGTIYQIDANYINAASIKTTGVDVAGAYLFEFGGGQRLRFALNYTYLDKLSLQPVKGEPTFDNVGQLNGTGRLGAGFEHRANALINYSVANLSAQWRTNYLSSIEDTRGQTNPTLIPLNRIGAYFYHDMQLRLNLGSEEQYGVYLGVDNVFNKKPPVINQLMASHVTGTETAADTYDPIGRFIYGGVQLKF
jgi:outer membrane receptor protein involved in Fe transport